MEYRISEFAQDLMEDVRKYSLREIRMRAVRIDRQQQPSGEILEKIRELGLTGIFLPAVEEEIPLTMQEQAALLGELGSHDAGSAVSAAVADLAFQPVKIAGTQEQKDFCGGILEAGGFGAFCLTEDNAGSDISTVKTRAVRVPGGYVLNGSKTMITNSVSAEFLTVFAVLDGKLAAFLVPGEAEGIQKGEPEQKLGIRTSETGSLWFNDVQLSEKALIGAPDQGRELADRALNIGRMHCAAIAIGLAERALEETISRIRERTGFDKPLSDNPVIRTKLAEMYLRKEAAKGVLIHALENVDSAGGEDPAMLASAAKCLASDAAVECTMEAVQLFGGYGYCQDYPVEKLMRDAKAFQIIEGANEIQKMIIGRKLVK